MTKYLQIRHWDYWWGVYKYIDAPTTVEFSITMDRAGEQLFFHLDVDTLPALEHLLKSGEYMEKDSVSFTSFHERVSKLKQGSLDYFVGSLYYRDYVPDIDKCNQFQKEGKDIFSVKSPQAAPYYAELFIRERRPLLPQLLIEWMERLSLPLFGLNDTYEIANVPTYESTGESYREDH